MSKTSTQIKMKWNRHTYRRYEFNIRADSKLNALVEKYKATSETGLTQLIKELICGYFGIEPWEADDIYVEYHYESGGKLIRNTALDKYFM